MNGLKNFSANTSTLMKNAFGKNVDGEIKYAKNETYVKINNNSIVGFITIRVEEVEVTDLLASSYTYLEV